MVVRAIRKGRKRRTRRSARRVSPAVQSEGARQLRVYNDAFSLATLNPKIPDGSVLTSIGQRNMITGNKAFPSDTTEMWYYLFPGYKTYFTSAIRKNASHVVPDVGVDYYPLDTYHNNESDRFSITIGSHSENAGMLNLTEDGMISIEDTTGESGMWRLVSSQLSLKNINNDDNNEGWWESVRFPLPRANKNFLLNNHIVSNVGTGSHITLNANELLKDSLSSGNWASQPSYQSGSMAEMDRMVWSLRPNNLTHPWRKKLSSSNVAKIGLYAELTPPGSDYPYSILQDSVYVNDDDPMVGKEFDRSFDCICVHVTGKVGTSVLADAVQNIELAPDIGDSLSRYATETHDMGSRLEAAQRMNRRNAVHGGHKKKRVG